MQLEIPLSEVQQFISNQFNIKIGLRSVEKDKIEAKYIDTVVLIIHDVKDNMFFFSYEVDGLANIASKVAHFFMKKKLNNTPIDWDLKNSEITIDLNKFTELTTFLQFVSISKINFIKDSIVLELYQREKIQ